MAKPTLIAEFKLPAFGGKSQGSIVLRDCGEAEPMRYVTHWRNEEFGGFINGNYWSSPEEGAIDFEKRVEKELTSRNAVGLPVGPFTWEVWGSHKDEGNDDCWTGDTVDSLDQALAELRLRQAKSDVAYSCIETPAGRIFQQINLSFLRHDDDFELDRSEAADQHGMAFGTRGSNEVLGEDVEESGPKFR